MNFIIKYLNFLIKFLRKNLLLSLFLIFLLIFGFFQLSIGNFTSSDFTMTNTDLVGSNIQIISSFPNTLTSFNFNTYMVNPSWFGYQLNPKQSFTLKSISQKSGNGATQCRVGVVNNAVPLVTGNMVNDNCLISVVLNVGTNYYIETNHQNYFFSGSSANYPITSSPYYDLVAISSSSNFNGYTWNPAILSLGINSVSNPVFQTSGSMVQTTPTTTTAQYDTLTLDYNETLNGGTIIPTLIVNGVETSLTNNVLTGSFPVGTNVSVKFSFTGSTSATPQLNNNIVLSGSYTAPVVANSNSNVATISKKNVLSILSAVAPKPQVQTYGSTSNKFQDFLRTFFNSIWGFLGV